MEIAFHGKRVLVTGASRGIGRSIAIRLAEYGAEVIAVATSLADLESLHKQYPTIRVFQCDCTKWQATEDLLRSVGDLDLCVNNAGIAIVRPLLDITESDCEKTFAINVTAMIHCTQFVARRLKERKSPGSIVNLSSQASTAGILDHGVYCASKGAVDGFTRAAAVELGPFGIRVNSVNPTVILTDMGRKNWSEESKARPMMERIPLKRFGEVSEVVDAVVFLLSDKSAMITGTCLPVDGGYLAN